jgi:hypothetical protein
MAALAALAFTLPPSLAFVAWAWLRLQRERDRKVADQHTQALARVVDDAAALGKDIAVLIERVQDAEKHIGQLTDRSLR